MRGAANPRQENIRPREGGRGRLEGDRRPCVGKEAAGVHAEPGGQLAVSSSGLGWVRETVSLASRACVVLYDRPSDILKIFIFFIRTF